MSLWSKSYYINLSCKFVSEFEEKKRTEKKRVEEMEEKRAFVDVKEQKKLCMNNEFVKVLCIHDVRVILKPLKSYVT